MSKFKIIPLSKQVAANIRKTGVDDFGHTVSEQVATGKGPCRVSLQPFRVGVDVRILLSHSPFDIDNLYNQPGPVFIHKMEVEEYSDIHCFPSLIKKNPRSFPLSLIGYDKNQQMCMAKLVGEEDVDLLIEKIFDGQPNVEYLHARNAQAGCYICKIERWEDKNADIGVIPFEM